MSTENELDNGNGGSDFDFDAGVADIATGLGLGGGEDDQFEQDAGETAESDGEPGSEVPKPDDQANVTEQAAKAPPQSWAKEHHETWAKLPPEAQEYIELREKQIADGMNGYKEISEYARAVDQAIAPYRQEFQQAGVDEVTAIRSLMEHHRAITQGTLEQRQQAFIQIGIASGLIPQEGQSQPDPQVQVIRQELQQLKQAEALRQQQYQHQVQSKLTQDVEAFAAEHEHFDDVADEIVAFLQAGMDLQAAYEKAVWANPSTRAKEIAKQVQADTERKRKEAEAAKKASSANVRASSRQRVSDGPTGDWGDTMAETLAAIKNR